MNAHNGKLARITSTSPVLVPGAITLELKQVNTTYWKFRSESGRIIAKVAAL